MIHPLATFLFDAFLIGSASSIIAAMTIEYLANRGPAVGRHHVPTRTPATRRRLHSGRTMTPRRSPNRMPQADVLRRQQARAFHA